MAIRAFQSRDGVAWRVWNVLPGRVDVERRTGYDRRSPDPVIRYTGPDRRREGDDRRQRAQFLSPGMAKGWLTFESSGEKRRLAPIPQQWEALPDAELERLCAQARPVSPPALPQRGGDEPE